VNDERLHQEKDGPGEDPIRQAREDLYAVDRRLREEASSADAETLGQLLLVVEQINAELDIERVLDVAGRQIIEIFEAERVFIIERGEAGGFTFRLAADYRGGTVPQPDSEVSHAVIEEVLQGRRPVLVCDAAADPRFAEVSSVRHLQLHSVMAVPLLARQQLLGVVYADNRLFTGAFDERALSLLGIFANHVGIALRNAQLFRDLDATRGRLALAERLKAIGEIATFIAHEMKNPLGSIKIMLQSLEENWEDARVRSQVLGVVLPEISRLDSAVTQILEYARPTPLLKVPVALAEIVESAWRTLAPELGEQGASVRKDFEADLPPVLADGERLRGVLINLIRNSLEATSERQGAEIRLFVRRAGRSEQEVVVEDNGPGIPDDEKEAVFEPFRSSKKSGTGVGLALSLKVIREHGGRIQVEDAPGGGARFRVLLPIQGA
jgi:signal transduction histidine kinase